ncbi:tail fiber domain-containing protein [Limosilactobacillus allomucosae]|uniref:Tail fiber domain-containing protein n=1 Tax=Limosilactobacillus allomucosae TaxID=3142938 RepID=A0AAU7C258_9LACO
MGNTSTNNGKTAVDDVKVKLIIGEIGRDTKTGIIGRGYSFDNGNTFHVTDTIYGRLYDQNDADGLWNNGLHEKVKEKVNQELTNTVEPAIKQADSAVAYANEAIEKSRVNSQSIVEINSAVSDAVSDAVVARSDGLRAWNAAQSNVDLINQNYASASAAISSARTEAIAAADEAKASASAAQADIVAVRSDVAAVQADVTATQSDVAVAKSDIADTKTSLTSQAKSLSSYASQASANGADIVTLKSQAGQLEQDMADTKGDVSQLKVSASSASVALSDAAGNISSLQATANSYSAALSDTNSNVASVTATASELETKYADAAGDISQIKATAKGMTQTISNAQGDIAKLKTRADGFDTQFTNAKSDIAVIQTDATGTKQTLTNAKSDIAVLQSRADGFDTKFANTAGDINRIKLDAKGFSQTLTSAKGDISTLQATATGFKNTLTDAQGNISTLQSDVSGLKKTTSDHAGNIATLQADANTLTSQMSSAQGDISTLKQTASGFSSKVSGMETSLANANSKIDDITSNGGGRNLAIGTDQEYTMGYGIPTTTWENGYAYLKLPTNTINREVLPQYPHTFYHTLTKGTTYTQTIWFETDAKLGNSSGIQITWFTSVEHDGQPATLINLGENKYKLYSTYMWPGKSDNSVRLFDIFYLNSAFDLSTGTYLKFGKLMLEEGTVSHAWSPAPEDTDVKITTNSTAIDQNKKAIALKADQETVNKTNRTVQQLQSQLKVQADQIASKVSSSDLDAKGYATQTYTQTQVKQTADSINANLTSVKNGLTDKYTNLSASVDGIKADVYNSDGSSKITQLSNLIATKVSSGDYNSQITQLKNDINLRVQKGNVVSQINQEAGGNTLIQVSNGKGKLALNASSVVFSGSAFIPVACIADLTADKIKTGTLTGSTVHLGDSNGNTIDLGVLGTNHVGLHSSAKNGDQTYIDYNGVKNSGTGYSTTISQGKITTGYMTVNGGGLIDFRSSGNGTTIDSQNIKFYNSNAVNGGIEFSGGNPIATVRNGTGGNELRVRYDRSFALTPIKDESARICASSAAMQVGFVQSGRSTPDRQTTGLWVDGDKRHVNLGVWGADSTWARVEANTHNIHMQADKAHACLSSDNVFHIYKDGDSSSTATKLQVDGWAWINGWVEAAGHSQHSALSTKTDIQSVDDDKMLEMVNGTDLTTFLYKTDVANGDTHRHIGLIIDDVHDVAQYQTPQDFIAPNGVSRDDDNMIGALFGAVKALTKRIKTLESKVG